MTEPGVDVEQLFNDTVLLQKQLRALVDSTSATGSDVAALLQTIRAHTQTILFADIEFAREKTLDEKLWTNVHYRVIENFKKRIAAVQFAMSEEPDRQHERTYETSRPVEFRKLIDSYTRFLKDTTTFYRVLIATLVSQFNIVDLEPIVTQFQLPFDVPPEAPKFQSKKVKALVYKEVQSCLTKLGDISRYRALTPRRTRTASQPDYGPAYGYYSLAQSLLPENGAPANQLAVLSTYGRDHLASTYYFYRALACAEPFPTAGNNLDVGFKKVLRDGVGVDAGEREDVGRLIEAFLRMHAELFRAKTGEMVVDGEGVVRLLGTVIRERLVEATFLKRLTFINLAALYVAEERQQPNASLFLDVILSQYTLLLNLLSADLESVDSSDVQAHLTPLIRRTIPALRLYSKWLVLHHPKIPPTFWPAYVAVANALSNLWPAPATPPKLSTPLEEDLAAAGFAPLEAAQEDPSKRKQKRDRARIGNRKKGLDKLLLQWGRRGGDSHVASRHAQKTEHPNVETTLRLADLLSDAVELATIPSCPVECVEGRFWIRGEEEEMGRMDERIVSTGLPAEAVGEMSLDDEMIVSSEDDGMDFSPGKMVDDIVGPEDLTSPSEAEAEEEEIVFRGKATRKQLFASPFPFSLTIRRNRPNPLVAPTLASPIHLPQPAHVSPLPSPITAVAPAVEQPRTVMDLMMQAFPKNISFSSTPSGGSPMNLSPHLQTVPHVEENAGRGSPRAAWEKREGSPIGVIGSGRASPRRTDENPRWSGGFPGI